MRVSYIFNSRYLVACLVYDLNNFHSIKIRFINAFLRRLFTAEGEGKSCSYEVTTFDLCRAALAEQA